MVVRNCANVVLLHGNGEIGGSADEVDLSAAGVSIYDTQPLPWGKNVEWSLTLGYLVQHVISL